MVSSSPLLPVLRLRREDVAPAVLVVGDADRAGEAAGLLDSAERVAAHREFVTYTGALGGRRLSICSHGVGSPGAAICFEELIRAGASTLLRAGTCGALRDDLADGSLVLATGAVRDEGTTPRLVPLAFPAIAHHDVVRSLVAAARRAGTELRSGVVLTSDTFYPSPVLPVDWRPWQRSRVVAVEMELSALLIVAALHGIRAGGILTVDGNPTAGDMSDYDPHRQVVRDGISAMLSLALAALVDLTTPEGAR